MIERVAEGCARNRSSRTIYARWRIRVPLSRIGSSLILSCTRRPSPARLLYVLKDAFGLRAHYRKSEESAEA